MYVEQFWKFVYLYSLLYLGPSSDLWNIKDHEGTNNSAP